MAQSNEPTISEMNSVIARFDGGELISDCSIIDDDLKRKYWQFKGGIVAADKLKYHKSWDALIPVIKKIKGMHLDILKQAYVLDYMKATAGMNSGLISLDIDKAHKGVYQFLVWYNDNQQKQTNGTTENNAAEWKGAGKGAELTCMVCGEKFMGPEPKMCCSGRDCGCMGLPVEPIVCSKECYEKGIPPQKGDSGGTVEAINDPCPHCGKELSRDRNLCCRECGKEVEG